MTKARPNCLTCGVCCCSLDGEDPFCEVTEADIAKLGAWARRNVDEFGLIDFVMLKLRGGDPETCGAIKTKDMVMKSGPLRGKRARVCIALSGSLLGKVRCRVYEKRPEVCRHAVRAGDPTCLQLRRMFHVL